MHASNLAIVFAPTILRPPDGSDSYAILSKFSPAQAKMLTTELKSTTAVSNLGKAAKLVASLIVQHNWIFSGQEVEEDAENDLQQDAKHEESTTLNQESDFCETRPTKTASGDQVVSTNTHDIPTKVKDDAAVCDSLQDSHRNVT